MTLRVPAMRSGTLLKMAWERCCSSCAGPNPPLGNGAHHYYFWAYALATEVHGEPTREVFLDA
jgi:phosphatidylethanolamine-binding protein (PEBP) family uncharacterized protein